MPANFSELTRVQIPALLHLERLGYTFVRHTELQPNLDSNILVDVFKDALMRLNPDMTDLAIEEKLRELVRIADNDDLGREFYQKLLNETNCRLIDFDHRTGMHQPNHAEPLSP